MIHDYQKPLFKYMNADTAKKVLENKTIRHSSPSTFNDPYDANPPYKFANKNLSEDALEKLKKSLNDYTRNSYILSLSKKNDDLLMWGHYANCHKGIVLEFQPKFVKHAKEIKYCNKIAEIDLNTCDIEAKKNQKLKKALNVLFQTKHECWCYEEEKRIIIDGKTLTKYLTKNKYNIPKNNYIDKPFEPYDIANIYLGAKINLEDEKKIIDIIKKQYPYITKIYKAKLSEDEYKISFEEIPINKSPVK